MKQYAIRGTAKRTGETLYSKTFDSQEQAYKEYQRHVKSDVFWNVELLEREVSEWQVLTPTDTAKIRFNIAHGK